MTDFVIIAIVLVIVGLAGRYIYKAKKSGAKCIGCAVEGGCPHKAAGACSCGSSESSCSCHTDAG